MRGLDDDDIHVLTPKGSAPPRLIGVDVHESRRWREQDVITESGIRRTRSPVAAVHPTLWGRSERQATYFLILAVQQRVATPQQLAEVLDDVRRHRLRKALLQVVAELIGGARSLGELDVGRAMRARRLPEPDRQSLRIRPSGKQYLDADFDAYAITLEVDGWQHDEPANRLTDLLRDLALSTEGRTIVRIPLVAWRWNEALVLDALEELFRSRGWNCRVNCRAVPDVARGARPPPRLRLIDCRVSCPVGSDVAEAGGAPPMPRPGAQPKRPVM